MYDLKAKDLSGVILKSQGQQVLLDQSINQTATETTMEWKMPSPFGFYPIIWAHGANNSLGYHGPTNRGGPFYLFPDYCANAADSNSPMCKSDDLNYDQMNVLVAGTTGPILTLYSKKIKLNVG